MSSPITPRLPGIRFVHSPGPTHVPDEVMHAMQRPMTDLADPRVAALIVACEKGMKELLKSPKSDVYFYASNGHGVWEAVAANLGSDDHSLLIAGSGHFSDQWAIQTQGLANAEITFNFFVQTANRHHLTVLIHGAAGNVGAYAVRSESSARRPASTRRRSTT